MTYSTKFMYNPGGENESGHTAADNNEDKKDSSAPASDNKQAGKEHKTVMEKIKEALHDWSNKDEQDQEFDDTRV